MVSRILYHNNNHGIWRWKLVIQSRWITMNGHLCSVGLIKEFEWYYETNNVLEAEMKWNQLAMKDKSNRLWVIMNRIYKDNDQEKMVKLYKEMNRNGNMTICCQLLSLKPDCFVDDGKVYRDIVYQGLDMFEKNGNKMLGKLLLHHLHKLDDIKKYRIVFDKLKHWMKGIHYNLLMNMYNNHKMYSEALEMFESNKFKDEYSYCIMLNVLKHTKDKKMGQLVCKDIANKGYKSKQMVSSLITYFGSIQDVKNAELTFQNAKSKNSIIYNAMISAYCNNKMYQKGLNLFFDTDMISIRDKTSYILAINICSELKDKENFNIIWDDIKTNYDDNIEIQTALINYFGKIGEIEKAEILFDSVKIPNITMLNSMMKLYVSNNLSSKALDIYFKEQNNPMKNEATINLAINACTHIKDKEKFKLVHQHLLEKRIKNIEVDTSLIHYYSSINDINQCEKIFDNIINKDIVCYNAMITAYMNNNLLDKALAFFYHDDIKNIKNETTYNLGVNICIQNGNDVELNNIYEQISRKKMNSVELNTSLINYFGTVNNVSRAYQIFCSIKNKSVPCFNSMMKTYIQNNQYKNALQLFLNEMRNFKDSTSYNLAVISCTYLKDTKTFTNINNDIIKYKYNDVELLNSLIHYYSSINDIKNARITFDNIKEKTVTSFGAIMNAYRINEYYDNALELFHYLQNKSDKYELNEYIYSCALYCCAGNSSLSDGEQIINSLTPALSKSPYIQAAIITLYGKCKQISQSHSFFQKSLQNSTKKSSLLYASIMDVYSKLGDTTKVLELYHQLISNNIPIDNNIWSIIIQSCSHSNNIQTATQIFTEMTTKTTIITSHILTSYIDCFARNNQLSTAISIFNKYGNSDVFYYTEKLTMLTTILSASIQSNNIIMAEHVIHLMESIHDDIDPSIYTLLANIYAKNKDFDKESQIRSKIRKLACQSKSKK